MKLTASQLAKSAYEKLGSNDTSDIDELRRLRDAGDSEAAGFLLLLEGTRSGVNKRPELSRMLSNYFPEYKSIKKQSAKDAYSGMVQSAFDRIT